MAEIKDKTWLESLCRSYTEANVRTLAGWANGPETNDDLKIRAIQILLERGWGKPSSAVEHTGKDGAEEIKILIRTIVQQKE